jgi:hypothetical protein
LEESLRQRDRRRRRGRGPRKLGGAPEARAADLDLLRRMNKLLGGDCKTEIAPAICARARELRRREHVTQALLSVKKTTTKKSKKERKRRKKKAREKQKKFVLFFGETAAILVWGRVRKNNRLGEGS